MSPRIKNVRGLFYLASSVPAYNCLAYQLCLYRRTRARTDDGTRLRDHKFLKILLALSGASTDDLRFRNSRSCLQVPRIPTGLPKSVVPSEYAACPVRLSRAIDQKPINFLFDLGTNSDIDCVATRPNWLFCKMVQTSPVCLVSREPFLISNTSPGPFSVPQ